MTTESLQAVSHAPSRFRADVWHSKGRPSGPLLSQAAFGAFSLLGQDAQPELRNSNKCERCKTKGVRTFGSTAAEIVCRGATLKYTNLSSFVE